MPKKTKKTGKIAKKAASSMKNKRSKAVKAKPAKSAGKRSPKKKESESKKATPKKTTAKKADVKSGKPASGKESKKAPIQKTAQAFQPAPKEKSSRTVLSMAFEEVKPVVAKPRITRSRSGNLLYQLEYVIRSSPSILYNFLTTPSGLAQWFADRVDFTEPRCSFEWDGSIEYATVIDSIDDEYIRYRWDNSDEDEYFEFKITKNEITGDTILIVTDFAAENDVESQKLLWDSQVKILIQQIGG